MKNRRFDCIGCEAAFEHPESMLNDKLQSSRLFFFRVLCGLFDVRMVSQKRLCQPPNNLSVYYDDDAQDVYLGDRRIKKILVRSVYGLLLGRCDF